MLVRVGRGEQGLSPPSENALWSSCPQLDFAGVGADRFLPIPIQRVDACGGETAQVILGLHAK